MAVTTLRPSGDGTTTGWTVTGGTGSHASAIVDDPDGHDGDTSYVLAPNLADGEMWVQLDDVPAGFQPDSINSITIKAAAKKVNTPSMAVDTTDLYLLIDRADEATQITTESAVCNVTDTGSYVLFTRSVSVTGGPHSVTDWNGARLSLRQDQTTNQTPDSVDQIRVTAVEVIIDYNDVPSPSSYEGSNVMPPVFTSRDPMIEH